MKNKQSPSSAILTAAARVAPRTTAAWVANRFLTPRSSAPRPDESEVLAGATMREIDVAGRTLATYRWGEDGPVALLVHGWSGAAAQMTPLVDPLLEEGFSVVAFDAPAHGLSQGRRTSVAELADAIVEIAESVGGAAFVVAHSMGAAATAAAVSRGAAIGRIAMVAPAPGARAWVERLADDLSFDAFARAHLLRTIEASVGATLEELELEANAAAIDVPVLVVSDADDRVVRASEQARVLACLPHARAFATHGLGHRRVLRDGRVIEEIAAFARPALDRSSPRIRLRELRDPHLEAFVRDVGRHVA